MLPWLMQHKRHSCRLTFVATAPSGQMLDLQWLRQSGRPGVNAGVHRLYEANLLCGNGPASRAVPAANEHVQVKLLRAILLCCNELGSRLFLGLCNILASSRGPTVCLALGVPAATALYVMELHSGGSQHPEPCQSLSLVVPGRAVCATAG